MKQKIALLYLKTGGGHLSGAKAISRVLSESYSDTSVPVLHDGFTGRMRHHRFFFEFGYQFSTNYFESFYVLFYYLTRNTFLVRLLKPVMSSQISTNLARFIRREGITKVVVLHSLLVTMARDAIDSVDPSIPLITVVMDPFSAHYGWFYEKRTELIVFSRKLLREATDRYSFPADKIHLFPFMLSPRFSKPFTEEEKQAARKRLGFSPDTKIILIAGGGEGLKGAGNLVKAFLKQDLGVHIAVVCGKNRLLKKSLDSLSSRLPPGRLSVYGFVDFMSDLMNVSDCIVTKGGPSTVMEVLAVRKPVILSTFIRPQERGNMLFIVENKVGWYYSDPEKVVAQARNVLENSGLNSSVLEKIDALQIRNGIDDIVRFIHDY